jgi:hypothetical protein
VNWNLKNRRSSAGVDTGAGEFRPLVGTCIDVEAQVVWTLGHIPKCRRRCRGKDRSGDGGEDRAVGVGNESRRSSESERLLRLVSRTLDPPSDITCISGRIAPESFFEHLVVGDDELEVGIGDVELDFEVCFGFVGLDEQVSDDD